MRWTRTQTRTRTGPCEKVSSASVSASAKETESRPSMRSAFAKKAKKTNLKFMSIA